MNTEKLKALRKGKKLSQMEIAKILGISQPTYATYENGTREPSNKMLVKLSQIFNTSTDFLLDNEKQKKADELTSTHIEQDFISIGLTNERYKTMSEEDRKGLLKIIEIYTQSKQ